MKPIKRTMIKLLIYVYLILAAALAAYAYDGTIIGGYTGSISRYDFIQTAADSTCMEEILYGIFEDDVIIYKLFLIGEDDVDPEDVSVINSVYEYMHNEYFIENRDMYSHFVIRGKTDEGGDGWLVLSHYVDSSGWLHYLWYFSIGY